MTDDELEQRIAEWKRVHDYASNLRERAVAWEEMKRLIRQRSPVKEKENS